MRPKFKEALRGKEFGKKRIQKKFHCSVEDDKSRSKLIELYRPGKVSFHNIDSAYLLKKI